MSILLLEDSCSGVFFSDISEDTFRIKEINQENIQKLFSGWDEEKPNKHSLYMDLLLLSN